MFDKRVDVPKQVAQSVETPEQIDKRVDVPDSIENKDSTSDSAKITQMPEHLTEEFWWVVTPDRLKEKLKNIKNVNEVRPDNERSMLHLLVKYGQYPEMIGLLISAGVDYTLRTGKWRGKALHYAVVREENPLLWTKEMLKYDPNINDPADTSSPLLWAAYNRAPSSVIKLLLEKGVDPHFQHEKSGGNAVMAACSPNTLKGVSFIDPETIQLFLDYKVDIKVKDKEGKTAFDYMKENEEFIKTDLFKKLATQFQ